MLSLKQNLRILGVMDENPFASCTWSGSSKFFFESLKEKGVLESAISAELSPVKSFVGKIRCFHPNLKKWRFLYHINIDNCHQRTRRIIKKIRESYPDFNIILQVGAWYDLTGLKDKMTVSYHDGNIQAYLNSPFGYPKVPLRFIKRTVEYEKHLYRKMDMIFPMSEWLGRSFIEYFGIPERKVIPVGAGINLPKIKEVTGKDYTKKNILFVGKSFDRKGGPLLLAAFQRVKREIPDATLVIIGPELKQLPDGVTCLSFIDKRSQSGLNALLNEYANASIFVMPSLYEPFGISFAEAMAHRLPCIGTNICAMPEIIDHGKNGFIVPVGDSKDLADKIIFLLRDEKLCRSMGDRAYSKYYDNYRWEIVCQKIISSLSC